MTVAIVRMKQWGHVNAPGSFSSAILPYFGLRPNRSSTTCRLSLPPGVGLLGRRRRRPPHLLRGRFGRDFRPPRDGRGPCPWRRREDAGRTRGSKRTTFAQPMASQKRLLILGSTGSIGTQALEVCRLSGELELVGLSAERSWEGLVRQASAHGVRRIALADERAAARAAGAWTGGEVLGGAEGLVRLVVESGADLVLNALVGSAGLGPTVATLGEGIDLALANKESLVVGGELVGALAEATGAQIVPVDSEHTALHQLLAGQRPGSVDRLTITASGGPFRGRRQEELQDVTVKEALAHPTWAMGGKITIDSATLMNKGVEVIAAQNLFGTPYERIGVVVHPR